jgi:hypothetical protein
MAVNVVGLCLMPLSQVTAWWLVLKHENLFKSVFYTSVFYACWALFKKIVEGDPNEIGMYTMVRDNTLDGWTDRAEEDVVIVFPVWLEEQ